MFRGRPPPRGSYRPPFDSRGPPPPPRPYHHQRADDRNRARSPYHSGYHRREHPDYHHSPPHRSYYPPASAGHRGDQHRSGAPPRERSPSPRHRLPIDHKLVITVGNELTSSATPRQHSRDRSTDIRRGRSRSRARSKSRHCSRSRSKSGSGSGSRSRSRSRGRIRGRASSRAPSRRRSSSSNSSSSGERHRRMKMFGELEVARRRKELEDLLSLPTKSILKKRSDYNCSPTVRGSDSALSHVAQELLRAVKGMEPAAMASVLSELRSDPQMSQRADRDPEIEEILNLLDPVAAQGAKSPADDMDDEEKFLYGDSEDPELVVPPQPLHNHAFDPYGDVTEDVLYGDLPRAAVLPAVSPVATGEAFTDRPPSVSTAASHTAAQASIPGPPPEEENHRQAQEDYQKLQDLLKTIGLDLGVAELSKLTARTKERLHGNKPAKAPNTAKRRPRYSSESSGDGRGRRSLSRSSDDDDGDKPGPGVGRAHGRNADVKRSDGWSKDGGRGVGAAPDEAPEQTVSLDGAAPVPSAVPVPPSYRASPASGAMAPGYPLPGCGQYGNFLPYAHPQWPPPMYPPPSLQAPGANSFPPALPYHQPDSQRLPEPPVKGVVASPWVAGTGPSQVSEQENNESQKQKVLEERENLRQEREQRMKKKEYLMKELERLRKQQGELLRKKRREKDGHKDPLLQEISLLQEDIMMQISNLRREHEGAEKKRSEIDKVALILGLGPSDRPRPTPQAARADHAVNRPGKSRLCAEHSQEGQQERDDGGGVSPKNISEASPLPEPFEYYDAGNHWCKSCNLTSGSMFDFFNHLHGKIHQKTLDPYERPWAALPTQMGKKAPTEDKQMKPAKGSEFLLPVRGFFCVLCEKFFGDAICAEEHVTTHCHNDNYKKRMYKNPLYEQRRNLDRQAGLTGKKRKPEEDKGDKTKSKKERKGEKEFGTEDASSIAVEEEEKPKVPKKEDELQNTKTPFYARKEEDDDDKVKSKKKSDKYHWSAEEGERADRRRDEEERHKQSQGGRHYRHHRHEEEPYERRPRHDDRHKREREREDKDGGKDKNAPGALKPYDPTKIICGPSPAMRAKLLKQSPDAAKLAPTFGKFAWRKRENQLAKDAQKAAAEFIKDDERAAKEAIVPKDDSFAKSVAFAKEIAQKLSGAGGSSAPRVSSGAGPSPAQSDFAVPVAARGRNRAGGKPAPLNAVPFVGPLGPGRPPAEDGPIFPPLERLPETERDKTKPASCESENRPARPASQSVPHLSGPPPSVPKAAVPVSSPPLAFVRPAPPVFRSVPSGPKPSLPASTPTPGVVRPAPPRSSPAATVVGPTVRSGPSGAGSTLPASSAASSVRSATPPPSRLEVNPPAPPSRPALIPTALAPSGLEINPAPEVSPPVRSVFETEMADAEPDVAAPGVPESEQTHAVFVKPPPLFRMPDGGQRADKPKSNLAAAKAQDLFGIFYSSKDKTGPLSLIKSSAADKSVTLKSPFVTQTVPRAAARPSKPSPQPDPGLAPSAPPQSGSELRIESICSLRTGPERAPAGVLFNSSLVESAQEEHPESAPAQTRRQLKTCEPKPDDENPPLWTFPEPLQETPPSPKAESAPGPRARGKNAKKGTSPSSGVPVRQTRSQTRSQTRLHHSEQTGGDADQKPSESPGDTDPKLSESAGDVDQELSESAGDAAQELSESSDCCSGTQHDGSTLLTPDNLHSSAIMADLNLA